MEIGAESKVDISHGVALWNGLHMYTPSPPLPSHVGDPFLH